MVFRSRSIAVLGLFMLAACQTPQEVRDLSTETGAAILQMSAGARQIANAAKVQAEGRLETLDGFSRDTVRGRIDLEGQIAASRKVGDPPAAIYDDIKKYVAEQDVLAQKLGAARVTAQEQVVKSQVALSVPTAEYKDVVDNLATLAKKKERWARIKATGEWVKDVVARVKEAQEQAEAAAKKQAAVKP